MDGMELRGSAKGLDCLCCILEYMECRMHCLLFFRQQSVSIIKFHATVVRGSPSLIKVYIYSAYLIEGLSMLEYGVKSHPQLPNT
jgi:hypothetical protein